MHFLDQIWFLIFAHFFADWGIWNSWLAQGKGKYWELMTAHCMIYTGVCCTTFYLIGVRPISVLVFPLFLSHFLIDQWKCNEMKKYDKWRPTKYLYIDQCLHLSILLILYMLFS